MAQEVTRYRAKTQVYWSNDLEMDVIEPVHLTVFEDDNPVDTGLLDESGNRLYRSPEKLPLGFDLRARGR